MRWVAREMLEVSAAWRGSREAGMEGWVVVVEWVSAARRFWDVSAWARSCLLEGWVSVVMTV